MSAPAALAVLKAAEEWLSDKSHWTTGTFARDESGWDLGFAGCRNGSPASTCVEGALILAARPASYGEALSLLRSALDNEDLPVVNDEYEDGYERIMAGLRKAIEGLEAER